MAWPTHQADDIGILTVNSKSDPDTPSGWTEVTGSPLTATSGTTTARLSVFWKRAASGAESNASVMGCGAVAHGIIMTWRGAITSGTPFDVLNTDTKTTLNKTTSIDGVTATENCNEILYVVARAGDNGATAQYSNEANSNLVGLQEIVDGS